jgi:hypothetical protein
MNGRARDEKHISEEGKERGIRKIRLQIEIKSRYHEETNQHMNSGS